MEFRNDALEAELKSHCVQFETQQSVMLTQDTISEIASEVIGNPDFVDGVASLVESAIASNHPPDDLLAEAASLPTNGTIVEKETYLNTGETASLVSGAWCAHSFGRWVYHEGHGMFWEVGDTSGWTNGCHLCSNGPNRSPSAYVESTNESNGNERVINWYKCA